MDRFSLSWEKNVIYRIVDYSNIRVYQANSEWSGNYGGLISPKGIRSKVKIKSITFFTFIILMVVASKVANLYELLKTQLDMVLIHFGGEKTI